MSALVHDTIVDLLGRGIAVRFQVHGDSMYPVIHSGDYVLVEPVEMSAVRAGDVVLSLTARGLTAHRVIAITATTITTRGDNAPAADPPFTAQQLLGRVRSAEHEGRARAMRGRVAVAVIRALRRLRRLV
jgi:signal peptidase I